MSTAYIPCKGDTVKIVGLHNDDAASKIPDLFIGKEYLITTDPHEFRPGCWGFACSDQEQASVFFAAIVEKVIK